MEVQITEMLEEHLKQIKINEFDDFWNENILKTDVCSPTSYYIIAKNKEEILGFAGLNIILDEAHIVNIAVKKDMRKQRIGSKLLQALIEKATSISSIITLEVNEQNIPAINLYQKYGFQTVRKKKKILFKYIWCIHNDKIHKNKTIILFLERNLRCKRKMN